MKLKVCEYCGTEYNSDQAKCPLCGKDEQEAQKAAPKADANDPERIPQWMWVLTCVLMGLAVLVGLVYFLVSMEYIGKKDDVEPVISAPVEEVPQEPVVVEPEDLSCTELTLSQRVFILDEQGSHVFLTAAPAPLGCEDPVSYASDDETIATVDEMGMITAVSPGETEIIVTCGDILETCTVICDFVVEEPEEETPDESEETPDESEETPGETEQPEEDEQPEEPAPQVPLELNAVDFTLFRPGEETVLTVKNAPEDADISYASSDDTVVTVSDTGHVTAVGNGVATITVTVNGQSLTCIARCNLGQTTENNDTTVEAPTGSAYSLSHEDVTLSEESNESFILSLMDERADKVAGAVFSSSDSSVCVVESNGRVTAIGKGTATITVTYGGKTYTCIVR